MTEPTGWPQAIPKRRFSFWLASVALVFAFLLGPSVLFLSVSSAASPSECLQRSPGTDASTFGLSLGNEAADGSTTDEVTIEALRGAKVIATDLFVLENRCGADLDVRLVDVGGNSLNDGMRVEIWLAEEAAPTGIPGMPNNEGWESAPLIVDPVGAERGVSGAISLRNGERRPVALVAYTSIDAPDSTTRLTWSVEAEPART